jgi:hypothetical protein
VWALRWREQRLEIITDLYKNKENLIATLNVTDVIRQDAFPGTRRDQLRIELFKAMAAKAGNEEAARKAFKDVFPDERFSSISGLGNV